ncbi:hypothetical protein [Nocardia fluminea]
MSSLVPAWNGAAHRSFFEIAATFRRMSRGSGGLPFTGTESGGDR